MERNKRKCFGLLLALFIMLGLSLSVFSEDSSAISDLTATIDDSNRNSFSFSCGSDCSSYHYLLVEDFSITGGIAYYFCPYSNNQFGRLNINLNYDIRNDVPFILFNFNNADQMSVCGSSWSNGSSFKVTLSENNPFGSSPTGTLSITENGIFDVSSYQFADVNVPADVVPGDYHDDLANIRNSILLCGGAILVIYFFYAIYKMILGGL